MAEKTQYLLIGGGLASACAAESIRERDPAGSVEIISGEAYFAYHRPPLSKSYLIEGDWEPSDTYHHEEDWYDENNVSFRSGVRATGLDLRGQTATLSTGETLTYEKLLLATGAQLIKLNVPGSDLEGLYYLREIPDSDALIKASEASERVVVVGGGFIGLELASAFQQRGLDVTLVYMEEHAWEQMLSPEISQWLADYYRSKEITLMSRSQVAAFRGLSQVETVVLKSGEELFTDMVALGIGVRPDLTLVTGTPLEGDNGVPVNEYLEADVPGVYAAGDIAWYQDIIFNKRRRVEHWDTAKGHGEVAGANMAGDHQCYRELPYFFSDLFDLEFEFVGDFDLKPDRVDFTDNLSDNTFIARYFQNNRIFAAVFVGREEEEVEAVKNEILEVYKQ
jgi:NADPH-dependent 2,4-dienoyl-CoA reductase/sulfur reductase-like enzyme